ncbi:MAG TPA: glycosyltransferase family 9 protein [Saprospiraceae bacterium]|jgi:heptosyltransferase-3|nr:glycosyltransferase family 9 protein [Saprospiraceae bacterium]MCC6689467.1 glycosyltransferase family 9 protein [Saprospiraceae bacterium]HMX82594.1 glycosyltransferase family 9 protein [Saprospiraceae bacterium]HMZ73257.1 glycosyltransferase family 9 protein [Saprospiraceae bacterium]HNA40893.1 glycosyltransferase family 9 protein [Saprospiraceae bacterium]
MPVASKRPIGTRIIISRTDSIGDVVLTLPLAGIIKEYFPEWHIIFLGRNYTREIVSLSEHVDEFVNWDDHEAVKQLKADIIVHVFPVKEIAQWAKKQGISTRIGTTGRLYHWLYCNKLIRLSRKNSDLHEAQLNIKLLKPLGIETDYPLEKIPDYYGFTRIKPLAPKWLEMLKGDRKNIILHPKSKGSAREWGLENFSRLIGLLPEIEYRIFISGTKEEGLQSAPLFKEHAHVIDLTGQMNLGEFASFIAEADALVAASTGPLHVAAALGKCAIGLYAPMRPIHPGRWAPLGRQASYLVMNRECNDCKKTLDCRCIRDITPGQVSEILSQLRK